MNISDFITKNQIELQAYHRDKDTLLNLYVSDRLNATYLSYIQDLKISQDYLSRREEKSLIRKMNRVLKNESQSTE